MPRDLVWKSRTVGSLLPSVVGMTRGGCARDDTSRRPNGCFSRSCRSLALRSEATKGSKVEVAHCRIPPPFGRRDDTSRRPNGCFSRSRRSLALRSEATKGSRVEVARYRIPPPFGRRDDNKAAALLGRLLFFQTGFPAATCSPTDSLRSTIGDGGLDCRVRHGTGYDPSSAATENPIHLPALLSKRIRRKTEQRQRPRRISTGQLNASLRLHLRPINPVVCGTPYFLTKRGILS